MRDSLLITIFLLFNMFVVSKMNSIEAKAPSWLERLASFLDENTVGKLFFITNYLIKSVSKSASLRSCIINY